MSLLDAPEIEMELDVPFSPRREPGYEGSVHNLLWACQTRGLRVQSVAVDGFPCPCVVIGPPRLVLALIPGLLERYEEAERNEWLVRRLGSLQQMSAQSQLEMNARAWMRTLPPGSIFGGGLGGSCGLLGQILGGPR